MIHIFNSIFFILMYYFFIFLIQSVKNSFENQQTICSASSLLIFKRFFKQYLHHQILFAILNVHVVWIHFIINGRGYTGCLFVELNLIYFALFCIADHVFAASCRRLICKKKKNFSTYT